MTLVYIDDCKAEGITGLTWNKMQLIFREIHTMSRVPRCQRIFVYWRSWWLGTTLARVLQHKLLPSNCANAVKVSKRSQQGSVEDGLPFRKGINQTPRCVVGDGVASVLKEVHSGDFGEHQGARDYLRTFYITDIIGLLWKLMFILCKKVASMSIPHQLNSCSNSWIA